MNEMIPGTYSRERREPQSEEGIRSLSSHRFQERRACQEECPFCRMQPNEDRRGAMIMTNLNSDLAKPISLSVGGGSKIKAG